MEGEQIADNGGFIKLYRSMLKWEWYDDINVKVLFLHLLLKANYENKRWHGIEIQKGEVITSANKLAIETGLSIQQVKTCLAKLKKTGEITSKPTSKFTLITIEKYSFFQSYEPENNKQITSKEPVSNQEITKKQLTNNQQVTNEQPADNQQVTTTKERKEYKELKKEKEIEEKEKRKKREERQENVYQLIADMYNDICVSLPKCTKLSETRKKALKVRLKTYTVEDFKVAFQKAEQCDFLKGSGDRAWRANFDWLIDEEHMLKTIEGFYDNPVQQKSGNIFLDMAQEEEGGVFF